ncbi:hypothetical protein VUR80DRAFT_9314 [Thermomyces stellatus]
MPRESTRSQTGNSRPRIFPAVDSSPVISRKKAASKQNSAAAATSSSSFSLKSRLTSKSGATEAKKGKNNGGGGHAGVMDRVRRFVTSSLPILRRGGRAR